MASLKEAFSDLHDGLEYAYELEQKIAVLKALKEGDDLQQTILSTIKTNNPSVTDVKQLDALVQKDVQDAIRQYELELVESQEENDSIDYDLRTMLFVATGEGKHSPDVTKLNDGIVDKDFIFTLYEQDKKRKAQVLKEAEESKDSGWKLCADKVLSLIHI